VRVSRAVSASGRKVSPASRARAWLACDRRACGPNQVVPLQPPTRALTPGLLLRPALLKRLRRSSAGVWSRRCRLSPPPPHRDAPLPRGPASPRDLPRRGAGRMVEVAANLTDEVVPHLPARQWVLSVPKRLWPFLHQTPTWRVRCSPSSSGRSGLRSGGSLNPHYHYHVLALRLHAPRRSRGAHLAGRSPGVSTHLARSARPCSATAHPNILRAPIPMAPLPPRLRLPSAASRAFSRPHHHRLLGRLLGHMQIV